MIMTQPTKRPFYFLIGGGGQVGYFLTKTLLKAKHEVVLIEKDPTRFSELETDLGASVLRGDACEVRVLERAGCSRADYILAVTGDDEDNLVMCQMARAIPAKKGNRRTIARVNNIANIELFKKLGIDMIVSPTQNILSAIESELPVHALMRLTPEENGGPHLVEVRVPDDSPLIGHALGSLQLPKGNSIVLVIRGPQNFTPDPKMAMQQGDKLFALINKDGEATLKSGVLGGEVLPVDGDIEFGEDE